MFVSPSQTCPLDLYTDCFYENRKEAIDSRVQLLIEASVETLHSMLEDVWTSQEGKVCSLVSWELFSSLQHAQVFTVNLASIQWLQKVFSIIKHLQTIFCCRCYFKLIKLPQMHINIHNIIKYVFK